ncbi:MAG: sigma-54 dependent transcriptional regulator, partial [Holophagales bacterium]|nr:sigma-54 dependent transcriptional regulator [Holophagales bacterium]
MSSPTIERGPPDAARAVPQARVLVVDDELKMAEAITTFLRRRGHACVVATSAEEALELFDAHGADVVVTDRRMPGMDGVALLGSLLEREPGLPVILVTAYGDVPSAVEAMRRGAFDYLTKPFDLEDLRGRVDRALELRRLERENRELRRQLADQRAGSLVAGSTAMVRVLERVDRAAASAATVLLTGESGTGKEVIARRVHFGSPRAAEAFVAVNCKAFSPGVIESELFGHEKGAFTGAESRRRGCFERADGGTLFLDEIGEVDLGFQAKLLRVLQEGEVQPVGGAEPLAVDVRVVAATNRDLAAAIVAGRFRED